jgi:hypothetical protein
MVPGVEGMRKGQNDSRFLDMIYSLLSKQGSDMSRTAVVVREAVNMAVQR